MTNGKDDPKVNRLWKGRWLDDATLTNGKNASKLTDYEKEGVNSLTSGKKLTELTNYVPTLTNGKNGTEELTDYKQVVS